MLGGKRVAIIKFRFLLEKLVRLQLMQDLIHKVNSFLISFNLLLYVITHFAWKIILKEKVEEEERKESE